MIVYNITIKVDRAIADDWIQWQQAENIPSVMKTGLFDSYYLYRLLDQDDTDGPTFVIQYCTSGIEKYMEYIVQYAPVFRQHAMEKWGPGFVAFRTVMESVN
jgi:hypothetical protein